MSQELIDPFGQLRSLMNLPQHSYTQREALWNLIVMQAMTDIEAFVDVWQPYIEGFPRYWEHPVTTCLSIKEFEHAATLLPFARFDLELEFDQRGDGLAELLSSPHLPLVDQLCLRENTIGDEGVSALAASPHFGLLGELDLSDNEVGDEGAKAIAASTNLSQLTSLNLGLNKIGAEGAKALATSPHLPQLTSLDLGSNNIGDGGAEAIAASPYLSRLTTLDVSGNRIEVGGVIALANSIYLSKKIRRQFDEWL